jgi:hypothetical protein
MNYIGQGTPRETLEVYALGIDPTHRDGEADLVQSRWFDYHDLHPAEATYLYAHHYVQQTRAFYEACIDIRTVEDVRAFTPNDIFRSRDLTAMWLARRAADAIGAPYPFVLRFAHDRALDRLYHRFPRPNQLYGEEFELDAADAWRELCARSIQFSRLPFFTIARYGGAPVQDRHIAFLIEQVDRRHGPKHRLLARLFKEGVLSPHLDAVRAAFSAGDLQAAQAYVHELGV